MHRKLYILLAVLLFVLCDLTAQTIAPLPIDSLWKSPAFLKAYTGSYGVDSNIEPLIKEDEAYHLGEVAKAMKNNDRKGAISKLTGTSLTYSRASLQFSLANLYFEDGNSEEAQKYFKKSIELFPNFRDAHRNLAMTYIKDEKFDEAEPHLVRAVELGSKEGLTFGLLAHIHTKKERHQAALSAYRLAQVTMPEERQWQLGEAFSLQGLDKFEEAGSIYEALIKKTPTDAELWLNQANAYMETDQQAKAIANMELVNRMGKLTPTNRYFLGRLYQQHDLPEIAYQHFSKAIATEKVSFENATAGFAGYVGRSHWKIAKLYSDLCLKVYKEQLESNDETTINFQRALALLELETGKNEAGKKRVAEIIEKNPLDGEALMILSRFHQVEENYEQAMELLEQAALVEETRAKALYQHGLILVNHFGEYQQALQLLDEAYQLNKLPSLASYISELRAFVK